MTDHARRCRVALAGFGTVGSAVARLLTERARGEVELIAIVNRDPGRKRVAWIDPRVRWTDTPDEVLDNGVDVFVELIGGRSPAGEWIREAMDRRISVVTANKQVMAHEGPALLARAAARGVQLRFEGSVAGGVPVIGAIDAGLAGDTLTRVAGILNGTCNYILSEMDEKGAAFAAALREAQSLGIAEADPSQDVDGLDARAKLAILAMVGLGIDPGAAEIPATSISAVDGVDFRYARRLGCTIRQIAWAETCGDRASLSAAVGPALVATSSAFAAVHGCSNLVTVRGRAGGETTFGGPGAGGAPTAVAVVSDVLAIARGGRPAGVKALRRAALSPGAEIPHYVRFTVSDRPGIIAAVGAILARHEINIDAVLQEPGFPASRRPFVMTLDATPARIVHAALAEAARLDFIVAPPFAMPILQGAAAGAGDA